MLNPLSTKMGPNLSPIPYLRTKQYQMLAIKGIYDGSHVRLLEKTPQKKKYKVIVTFVEEINEESELRDFTAKTEGLDFWLDEKEDIYRDYSIFVPKIDPK